MGKSIMQQITTCKKKPSSGCIIEWMTFGMPWFSYLLQYGKQPQNLVASNNTRYVVVSVGQESGRCLAGFCLSQLRSRCQLGLQLSQGPAGTGSASMFSCGCGLSLIPCGWTDTLDPHLWWAGGLLLTTGDRGHFCPHRSEQVEERALAKGKPPCL